MLKPAALLAALVLAGCASQPQVALPPPDEQPAVLAPEPAPSSLATDMAMFGERLRQVVALVVTGFLNP